MLNVRGNPEESRCRTLTLGSPGVTSLSLISDAQSHWQREPF